jgi:hypothetical protein
MFSVAPFLYITYVASSYVVSNDIMIVNWERHGWKQLAMACFNLISQNLLGIVWGRHVKQCRVTVA